MLSTVAARPIFKPVKYPLVKSEDETLDAVLAGASLARYGDGEWKLAAGKHRKWQRHDERLSKRLRQIMKDSGRCLVGIPNIRSKTPKHEFWNQFAVPWVCQMLTDRQYYSSFITRPDSAPWINRPDYWDKLRSLWNGKKVVLVRGSTKSLTADMLSGAKSWVEVVGSPHHGFSDYDRILQTVIMAKPDIALLCYGASATLLAVDLCDKGIQAVDLGHVGMFIRKLDRGEPLNVTAEDKQH